MLREPLAHKVHDTLARCAGFSFCDALLVTTRHQMPRPIEALIHTSALAHNLARARAAEPGARVWAVVKANAYGHGIERAFAGLRATDGFALLDLAEAERVRACGWRGPVLLLEGVFEPRDLELCSRLNLWHVVHSSYQIDWLAAHKTQTAHRVFLKMNSGMNRLGFTPEAYRSAWARLNVLPQVDEISHMTHFANADAEEAAAKSAGSSESLVTVRQQLARFETAVDGLPGERSVSNSAAILRAGAAPAHNDWVRAGIMTYGSAPDYSGRSIADWALEPTMTLRSRLIATQTLQAGDSVGYGSSYTATSNMRIGIVACGYADGYPRHCASGTPVLVNGVRCTTVGRVSMDMLAVDITILPSAGVGAEVTLWGRGPSAADGAARSVLAIDEVAHSAGTIGYELMCAVAQRVPMHTDES
jgi:alanine racemase